MTTREISNTDDVIDSRDVIARIEALQDERDNLEAMDDVEITLELRQADWDESEEGQELKVLLALQDDAEDSSDWKYGETLIRDSHFEDYAQELAEDCGMIERDVKWPYTCIDWERAASELQQDYMQVNFDGVDYWIRA
jgi:hypothetical protein